MRFLILALSLLSLNCVAEQERSATNKYRLGIGTNTVYSGLGLNYAKVTEHDMKCQLAALVTALHMAQRAG